MNDLYSVKQASEYLDVSKATLRAYTKHYSVYLSSSADVPSGTTRQYASRDIAILSYVREQLNQNRSHAEILKTIESDIANLPEWTPPPPTVPLDSDSIGNVIVPASQMRMIQTILEDERSKAEQLQDTVNELQLALGHAQGKAEQLERENHRLARSWWRKLVS